MFTTISWIGRPYFRLNENTRLAKKLDRSCMVQLFASAWEVIACIFLLIVRQTSERAHLNLEITDQDITPCLVSFGSWTLLHVAGLRC